MTTDAVRQAIFRPAFDRLMLHAHAAVEQSSPTTVRKASAHVQPPQPRACMTGAPARRDLLAVAGVLFTHDDDRETFVEIGHGPKEEDALARAGALWARMETHDPCSGLGECHLLWHAGLVENDLRRARRPDLFRRRERMSLHRFLTDFNAIQATLTRLVLEVMRDDVRVAFDRPSPEATRALAEDRLLDPARATRVVTGKTESDPEVAALAEAVEAALDQQLWTAWRTGHWPDMDLSNAPAGEPPEVGAWRNPTATPHGRHESRRATMRRRLRDYETMARTRRAHPATPEEGEALRLSEPRPQQQLVVQTHQAVAKLRALRAEVVERWRRWQEELAHWHAHPGGRWAAELIREMDRIHGDAARTRTRRSSDGLAPCTSAATPPVCGASRNTGTTRSTPIPPHARPA